MKIYEQKCFICVDCGVGIISTVIPGRVPDERSMNVLTHPPGSCASAGQVVGAPLNIFDTERIDFTRGPSGF